jgi:hypothetical protein
VLFFVPLIEFRLYQDVLSSLTEMCGAQVMKMVMTLLAPASGIVHYQQLEGAALSSGDLIARLDLDNPEAAQQILQHTGGFPDLGPPLVYSSKVDQKFKTTFAAAKNILQGITTPP